MISELTRVEVVSAIRRKSRDGEISSQNAITLIDIFEHELVESARRPGGPFVVIRVHSDILDDAVALLDRWPLKAADAVQLATARITRRVLPDLTDFLCFDAALGAAARGDQFSVRPDRS